MFSPHVTGAWHTRRSHFEDTRCMYRRDVMKHLNLWLRFAADDSDNNDKQENPIFAYCVCSFHNTSLLTLRTTISLQEQHFAITSKTFFVGSQSSSCVNGNVPRESAVITKQPDVAFTLSLADNVMPKHWNPQAGTMTTLEKGVHAVRSRVY